MLNKSFFLVSALLLSACSDIDNLVDGKKYLNSLDGPTVPTLNDTVSQSAREAEAAGNYQLAISQYKQLLDKDANNKQYAYGLAENYRKIGDNEVAISLYDQLLAKDASFVEAKEGKALALMNKGDFEGANQLLTEVMAQDGKRWRTLNALGILNASKYMSAEAEQYFNAALTLNPGSATILNNMGMNRALDKNFSGALEKLQLASRSTPQGSGPRKRIDLNMALVHAAAGDVKEAERIASQYFSGPQLKNNMGLYAHLARDDDMAKSYLNMALTESKTYYEKAWDNLSALSGTGGSEDAGKTPKRVTINSPMLPPPAADAAPTLPKDAPETALIPVTATQAKPVDLVSDSADAKSEDNISGSEHVEAKPAAESPAADPFAHAQHIKVEAEQPAAEFKKAEPVEEASKEEKALKETASSESEEQVLGSMSDEQALAVPKPAPLHEASPSAGTPEEKPVTNTEPKKDAPSNGFEAVGNAVGSFVKDLW